jgi:hypothetical protein
MSNLTALFSVCCYANISQLTHKQHLKLKGQSRFWRHDTQHNDTQHNDTQNDDIQHNDTQHKWLVCGTQHEQRSA